MVIDLTFSIGNLISIGGLLGFFFWVKFTLDRVIQVIWSPSGTVRLISFEAHDRMQEQCRQTISKDAGYINVYMSRIEKMLADQSGEIVKLNGKMDALAGCVAALKYGADGKDLDNC